MELIEILIIIAIICSQFFVFFTTCKQIRQISRFLLSSRNIKLDQTFIDLNEEGVTPKEPEYSELSQPLFLGVIHEQAPANSSFKIALDGDIMVGDKILVEDEYLSREGIVMNIFVDNSYSNEAHKGAHAEIQLDCAVHEDERLYKTAAIAAPKSAIVNVSVIFLHKEEQSTLLRKVIKTINNYLRKNKGGTADFHLVKDIVERHCDAIDEEINHKLPVPIYLGLMGTVMGIIIGLFSLNFQFDPQTNSLNGSLFVESVSGLINGVKLAMICSFVGLGMTTILSSWLYRGAKSKLEDQKNSFYDFIQTQLLPQMTRDAASTILSLQSNLEKFNSSFEENIKDFGGIIEEIHDTFDSQVKLQTELKKMDISQVANLNVNVLAQLRSSMSEFEKFTQYLGQMNTFVRSTAKLTDSINDQLQRTEAVETITKAMEENIQKNQLVMEKLRAFLERINEQQAVVTAAGEIDSTMSQAIEELKSHTQQQIRSIQTYTTEATADLHELVTSERAHLKNLDKLGKLDNLDKLVNAINSLKDDNHATNGTLESKIESLVKAVTDNTRAQRGESGIPSWLKFSCLVLFVITCFAIIYMCYNTISSSESGNYQTTPANNIEQSDRKEALDTVAFDSVM